MYNQTAKPVISIPVTYHEKIELSAQDLIMIPSTFVIFLGLIALIKMSFDIDRK